MYSVFTPDALKSLPNFRRRELRSFISANIGRRAAANEQVAESLLHVLALDAPTHVNRQALARVLLDQDEHPNGPTVANRLA